jgi:hypothetical protein
MDNLALAVRVLQIALQAHRSPMRAVVAAVVLTKLRRALAVQAVVAQAEHWLVTETPVRQTLAVAVAVAVGVLQLAATAAPVS